MTTTTTAQPQPRTSQHAHAQQTPIVLPPVPPDLIHLQILQRQRETGKDKPHEHDVLCGRGVTTNRHIGNTNFRNLVHRNKEVYVSSTKKGKMNISRSIVRAIRDQKPAGSFLEKDVSSGKWFDIGDKKAIEKTSQALRDAAAELRKKLSEDFSDPDFFQAVFDHEGAKKATCPADNVTEKNKPSLTVSPQQQQNLPHHSHQLPTLKEMSMENIDPDKYSTPEATEIKRRIEANSKRQIFHNSRPVGENNLSSSIPEPPAYMNSTLPVVTPQQNPPPRFSSSNTLTPESDSRVFGFNPSSNHPLKSSREQLSYNDNYITNRNSRKGHRRSESTPNPPTHTEKWSESPYYHGNQPRARDFSFDSNPEEYISMLMSSHPVAPPKKHRRTVSSPGDFSHATTSNLYPGYATAHRFNGNDDASSVGRSMRQPSHEYIRASSGSSTPFNMRAFHEMRREPHNSSSATYEGSFNQDVGSPEWAPLSANASRTLPQEEMNNFNQPDIVASSDDWQMLSRSISGGNTCKDEVLPSTSYHRVSHEPSSTLSLQDDSANLQHFKRKNYSTTPSTLHSISPTYS